MCACVCVCVCVCKTRVQKPRASSFAIVCITGISLLVLQHVAVYDAVYCNLYCSELQCVAAHLRHRIPTSAPASELVLQCVAVRRSSFQCVAMCVAVSCGVLQCMFAIICIQMMARLARGVWRGGEGCRGTPHCSMGRRTRHETTLQRTPSHVGTGDREEGG